MGVEIPASVYEDAARAFYAGNGMTIVHYHWNAAGDGLRECSLADELSEPTFWLSSADPPPGQIHEDPRWDGWVDVGWVDETTKEPDQ